MGRVEYIQLDDEILLNKAFTIRLDGCIRFFQVEQQMLFTQFLILIVG